MHLRAAVRMPAPCSTRPTCTLLQDGASAVPCAVAAAVGGQQVRLELPAGEQPITEPVYIPAMPVNMRLQADVQQALRAAVQCMLWLWMLPPTHPPSATLHRCTAACPPQEGDALRVLRLAAARLEGHADAAVRCQCPRGHERQL